MQKFGSIVSDLFIYRGIGFSAFLIVFMFMLTGVYYFFDIKKIQFGENGFGLLFLVFGFLFFSQLFYQIILFQVE